MISLLAAGFGGVHGDDGDYRESQYFQELGDNDISASTVNGWKFNTATVGGTPGKVVTINDPKDGLSTSTESKDGKFNYVNFSVTVDGELTKPSDEEGKNPGYSLNASRKEAKYFPIFGSIASLETNPGLVSAIKAYIPIKSDSIVIGALETILAGQDDESRTILGHKESDWSVSSPSKFYEIVTGEELQAEGREVTGKVTYSPFVHEPVQSGQYIVKGVPTSQADKVELTALVNVVAGEFTTSSTVLGVDRFSASTLKPKNRDKLDRGFCSCVYYAVDPEKKYTAFVNTSPAVNHDYFEYKLNDKKIKEDNIVIFSKTETKYEAALIQPETKNDGELIVAGNIGTAMWIPLTAKTIGVVCISLNGTTCSPLNIAPFKQANIKVDIETDSFAFTKKTDNDIWSKEDLNDLYTAFKEDKKYVNWFDKGYYYFQFTVPGEFTDSSVGGMADGRFSSVLTGMPSSVGAHELGHSLRLDDYYNSTEPTELYDCDNLMHNRLETELRHAQWKRMNAEALEKK